MSHAHVHAHVMSANISFSGLQQMRRDAHVHRHDWNGEEVLQRAIGAQDHVKVASDHPV